MEIQLTSVQSKCKETVSEVCARLQRFSMCFSRFTSSMELQKIIIVRNVYISLPIRLRRPITPVSMESQQFFLFVFCDLFSLQIKFEFGNIE